MILRQLEYFVVVAREQHFGRAATYCHASQPALSIAIRKLEVELGVELFHRSGQGTRLSEAGAALLPWAQNAVGAARDLSQEAGRLRGHLNATLRLGVIPTAAAAVPSTIGPLLQAEPGVRVEVRTMSTSRIVAAIESRDLDAGLAYVDSPPKSLHAARLYRERLVLLTSAEIPGVAPDAETIPWAALEDVPLDLLTPEMHQRRTIDDAFLTQGLFVRPRVETDSVSTLLDLVQDGGSAIVGEAWIVDLHLPPAARVLTLTDPDVAPSVGLLSPLGPLAPPVVRALRRTVPAEELV